MHIVEVDEHLDYKKFWEGRESTADAGHAWWELTQGLADTYPCEPCKPGAQAFSHGAHDAISILVHDRLPKTPEHFEALVMIVEEAKHKLEHMKAKTKHEVEE